MFLNPAGDPISLPMAQLWLERAASPEVPEAYFNLARVYAALGPGYDLAMFEAAETGAGLGQAPAQAFLGVLYWTGQGTQADPVLAYVWLSRSVASGVPEARETLDEVAEALTDEQRAEADRLLAQPASFPAAPP